MEIRDDVRHGYEKKLRKEPTCVFSDEIKIYSKMKVLVATEKPFAKVAVDGIREVVEKNGYQLALLEKYTDVNDLYKAVEDAEFLAHEFGAGFSVIEVTDGVDEHAHDEFGNGVAVLARGVHGDDATGGASLEVEVVETGAGADNNLQVIGVVDNLFGHFVGADDEGVGIGNGFVKVVHVGIFLEEGQGVAVFLNNFADTVDGNFGEGFLGSN